jgi:hypothetical protein
MEQSMNGLLQGLNDLLKPASEMVPEAGDGQSAMDAAMEAAIKQHAAKEPIDDGEGSENEPPMTIARAGGANVVFGKRGAGPSFREH